MSQQEQSSQTSQSSSFQRVFHEASQVLLETSTVRVPPPPRRQQRRRRRIEDEDDTSAAGGTRQRVDVAPAASRTPAPTDTVDADGPAAGVATADGPDAGVAAADEPDAGVAAADEPDAGVGAADGADASVGAAGAAGGGMGPSQSPDGSLIDALEEMGDEEDEQDAADHQKLSQYVLDDFTTIPALLRNTGNGRKFRFPLEPTPDEHALVKKDPHPSLASHSTHHAYHWQLTPPPEKVLTMDGVHKCLATIKKGSASLYVQPHEGYTWAFMGRCVGASIPEHIDKALYFFYRLMSDIESTTMTRYVVPTRNLELKYDREVCHVPFSFLPLCVCSATHYHASCASPEST